MSNNMKILTTAYLEDNEQYETFHDWLWALSDFAWRHPAHHEVPGNLPFDNISNAPTCLITYAFILLEKYSNELVLDIAVMNENERLITHYADGGSETFKGKVLFKYKKPYEALHGKKVPGEGVVPMVPFIGNFMPMPCDSASAEALRKRVSKSEKTQGLFTGYLAHIGAFVDFGRGMESNYDGNYVPYSLSDDEIDEEMARLLSENEEIKRYFGLFETYDDFIKKNFLQDFFADKKGKKVLRKFFKKGYTQEAYNEFSTISREIITNRGQRIIEFLMKADKKFRKSKGLPVAGE